MALDREMDIGNRIREYFRPASPAAKALGWLRRQELDTGGIRVHTRHHAAYPEVSGYLVPTLLAYGEKDFADRMVRWLHCIQRANGGFADPDHGREHVFDTGQVLRGLLAAQAWDAARRAAEYLCGQMADEGRRGFGNRYDGSIPESVHLYVLPALNWAAELLGEPRYRYHVGHCLDYYCGHEDFLRPSDLTHFLAYELEALIDLGRGESAEPVLEGLRRVQRWGGAVRGRGNVKWVCTPGLAQLAICWYKTGRRDAGDRAVAWLERHQTPSGGFLGSYGRGAAYFPNEEPSWAVKFFLDAYRLRGLARRERETAPEPSASSAEIVAAVRPQLRPGARVLAVACGTGKILDRLRSLEPAARYAGLEVSRTFLGQVSEGIERVEGPVEAIPLADGVFDIVFAESESERWLNPAGGIREMIRVVRPGGWVMAMGGPELEGWIRDQCDEVSPLRLGSRAAWCGRKRSPLTGTQWNQILVRVPDRSVVLDRIRHHQPTPWGQEMVLTTKPGQRVLEIGSGTGEISLTLAVTGRRVTVMDISRESLDFVRGCAAELGVTVETVAGDATRRLDSFKDGDFDCVWSSGLLEHFGPEERRSMLREWSRVSSGQVVTIVPNAGCLAYRIGKSLQEREGRWRFGLEIPLGSLRDDFAAAGLRVVEEYSVGGRWALEFLPPTHPLRKSLELTMTGKSEQEFRAMNQGYLLVTKGERASA